MAQDTPMNEDVEEPLLAESEACDEVTNLDAYSQLFDNDRTPNKHGFWSWLTFAWIAPVLHRGAAVKQLYQADLPLLPKDIAPDICGDLLWTSWKRELISTSSSDESKPSLLTAVFRSFGWRYIRLGFLKLINDALNFAGPIFLNGVLGYLDSKTSSSRSSKVVPFVVSTGSESTRSLALSSTVCGWGGYLHSDDVYGIACAVLLAASLCAKAFLNAHFSYRQGVISVKLRAAITSVVFRQTLSMPASVLQGSTVQAGRVQTLMSVDAERVVGLCLAFHELWSLPMQIGIALWLLFIQVQYAFIAGLGLVILIIPLNRVLAWGIQRASVRMMNAKDQRIAIISEILRGIRTIKASAWETVFGKRVNVARKEELAALGVRKYLDALCVYLWAATSLLFSVGTFGLFALTGKKLTPQVVFTSLALFNVLLGPINSFPWVINGIVEALVSLRRLQEFLILKSSTEKDPIAGPSIATTLLPSPTSPSVAVVEIRNGSFSWDLSSYSMRAPVLRAIDLTVPVGNFVIITGGVGSGKSSLLVAMLGELHALPGSHVKVRGRIAYAAQDSWAMPGTFRENVLMGTAVADVDEARYRSVLHACALDEDLHSMPRGDRTLVGDMGAALSGGQRARLGLARALYRDADVYILDDVLAAVDVHVGAWIKKHALLGPFLAGKTVIMTTHSSEMQKYADLVITMREGCISKVAHHPQGRRNRYDESAEAGQTLDAPVLNSIHAQGNSAPLSGEPPAEEEEESREIGHVRLAVFVRYLKMQGLWIPVILMSMTLMQGTRNASDMWLSFWASRSDVTAPIPPGVKYNLIVLLSLATANSVFTLIRAFSFAAGGLMAARRLHDSLLASVLSLPPTFWSRTPSGRVMNRFSSDIATTDDSLPFIANIFLAQAFSLAGIAAVLCYTQPLVAAAAAPITLTYRYLQRYYRATSRELRRLDSVAKSPIYSSFAAALSGGVTIRAQGAGHSVLRAAHLAVAKQQRASLAALATSNWLGLRLQLIAAGLAGVVSGFAVAERLGILPGMHASHAAGLVGLSLAYVLPITGVLNGLLTSGAETEQEMVAVERLGSYIDSPPQPPVLPAGSEVTTDTITPTSTWPHNGEVLFDDVWLQYGPSGPFVLQGFTLTIPGGSRVGVCGRTGAGKSSALACILRLVEIRSGSVSIDGIDVRRVPLRRLRQSIGYVAQSPFIFTGTVAENLDPCCGGAHGPGTMKKVLEEVGLWPALLAMYHQSLASQSMDTSAVQGLEGVLKMRLGEDGAGLSQGQQQMLCLARVVLRQPPLVCLDEASASVDPGTAGAMAAVVKMQFRGKTVVEIAHKLDSVMDCDAVCVVDKGMVGEVGAPGQLVEDPHSLLHGMLESKDS